MNDCKKKGSLTIEDILPPQLQHLFVYPCLMPMVPMTLEGQRRLRYGIGKPVVLGLMRGRQNLGMSALVG